LIGAFIVELLVTLVTLYALGTSQTRMSWSE